MQQGPFQDAICPLCEKKANRTVFWVKCSLKKLSCLITARHPFTDPINRHIVNHKNQVTTDNFAANLHWVSSHFNAFNRERKKDNGLFGISLQGQLLQLRVLGTQATFQDTQTAVCCYDLILWLTFGDQLDSVKDILNDLPNQERHVACKLVRDGVVKVWRIHSLYIVLTLDHIQILGVHQDRDTAFTQATTAFEERHTAQQKRDRRKDRLVVPAILNN